MTRYDDELIKAIEGEAKRYKKPYNTGCWANIEEGKLLRDLLVDSGSNTYIESGTCHGYSTCWAASSFSEDDVPWIFTFDIENKPKVYEDDNYPLLKELGSLITARTLPFHQGIETMPEQVLERDNKFFFIDGDHTTHGVETDWKAVQPYLKSGDSLLFHDSMTISSVRRTVARIAGRLTKVELLDFRKDFRTNRGMTLLRVK